MPPPADTILDLYHRRARDWEMDRNHGGPLIEQAWLERFAGLLPPGGTVLDAGCGSGDPIARWLIQHGFRLTGIDGAPGMIDICREKFPAGDWAVADLRSLSLGLRFDGVIAWHCLIHLSEADQPKAVNALLGHVRPGGVLLMTTGPKAGETMGEWRGETLYHGSLGASAYRSLLEAGGFEQIIHAPGDAACGNATVWLAQKKSPGRSRG